MTVIRNTSGASFIGVNPAPSTLAPSVSNINHQDFEIVKRLKTLMPIECEDKLKSLEEIISYVSAILYGDDLHKFAEYNYYKKYAIDAIDELILYVQGHSLDSFCEELEMLKREISELTEKKEKYGEDISDLEKERDILLTEVGELRREKNALLDESEKIKNSLDNYNLIMASDNSSEIVWEKVDSNNPIYGICPSKIHDYVMKLKLAYMHKLGISEEECDSDFMLNSSGLFELETFLRSLESKYYYKSISFLIGSVDCLKPLDIYALKNIMNNIKLPKVLRKKTSLYSMSSKDSNISQLLRELYFQRMALDAIAKQKIAETQLYSFLEIMKEIVPENYDISQVIKQFDNSSSNSIEVVLEDEKYSNGR